MGSGEFGSNGSVHWKVVHTADQRNGGFVHGKDPNKGSSGQVNTEGMFRLKLRFPSDDVARKALDKAASGSSNGIVYVMVPAPRRDKETDDLPWEIKIEW